MDREPECRSPLLFAQDADLAAHHLHNALRNGQPQPRPAEATRGGGVHLRERFEQAMKAVLGNPHSRVANLYFYQMTGSVLSGRLHGNGHFPAFRELDRIVHQVNDDLPQPHRIAPDTRRNLRIDRAEELQALFLGAFAEHLGDSFDRFTKVEVDRIQFQLARFDLGKIQGVVDQFQQRMRRDLGDIAVSPLLRSRRGRHQEVHHADDAVERRPQLVGHVGQEHALGAIGLLSRQKGLFEIAGSLFDLILKGFRKSPELSIALHKRQPHRLERTGEVPDFVLVIIVDGIAEVALRDGLARIRQDLEPAQPATEGEK